MRYVMIEKIAEEIAYDNGCVNAAQSLEKVLDKVYLFLNAYDIDFLDAVECYLSSLDRDELVRLASGTDDEMKVFDDEFVGIYGFNGLNEFLDEMFEETM